MSSSVARARARFFSMSFRGGNSRPRSRGSRRAKLAVAVVACLLAAALSDSLAGSALALANPSITMITPTQGTVGTQVAISGGALKRTVAPAVFLKKPGSTTKYALANVSVLATQILARVKSGTGLKAGDYELWVKYGKKLKVKAPGLMTINGPMDASVSPDAGKPGSTFTLNASYLGISVGSVTVDSKVASITSWLGTLDGTPGSVQFKLPTGLPNGYHSLKVSNGVGSAEIADGLIVTGQADTSGVELRLSNAAATSATTILVQFTKAVDPLKAELPDHYRITSVTGASTVKVIKAELERPDLTTVKLTTRPQSEIEYVLKALDIVDLSGKPIAAPSGPIPADPSATKFLGFGASSGGETDCDGDGIPDGTDQADCDGDGITDADEQRGYTIQIRHTDGSVETRAVTSDPDLADTDGDDHFDGEEKHSGSDPRSPDTDGDTLPDGLEWNVIYSNPSDQDSDGDGTQDGFEYWSLGTSPLLDDTDGDQLSDTEEVFSRNRNPLVADLPAESISIGDMRLQLDQRFTYLDEAGHTVSTNDSFQSTLETDTSSTHSDSTSDTLGGSIWGETGTRDGTDGTGLEAFFIRFHGEFDISHTKEFSDESSLATQRAYQQSLERANELATNSSVTREIVGASLGANVSILNQGNVAFSISNLQITVSERDPSSPSRLVPVATLVANTSLTSGGDTTFHLGPFNRTRGPVLFSDRDIFPNLVERLMRDPQSLVFTVANFDMTDELGRHFTYSNQIARDRTSGIFIDAGDDNVQTNFVSTSLQYDPDDIAGDDDQDEETVDQDWVGGFNANGSPVGIPADFALQRILGMQKNSSVEDGIITGGSTASTHAKGDDVQLVPPGTSGVPLGTIVVAAGPNGVLNSDPEGTDEKAVTTGYATEVVDGVERLARVGPVSNDLTRHWIVMTTGNQPTSADFGTLVLMPGQDLYLVYIQDLDEDGLYAREEMLVGSTDSKSDVYDNSSFGHFSNVPGPNGFVLTDPTVTPDGISDSKDTDHDGLGDFAEVRIGWKVSADGGPLSQVFSSPRIPDSDGDGLLDPQEQDLRSFCGPNDPRSDALCIFQSAGAVARDNAIAIIAGPNGKSDSPLLGDDLGLIPNGATGFTYGTRVVGPGKNNVIDTVLGGDDVYVSTLSLRGTPPTTDPLSLDTDFDGVTDYQELTTFKVGVAIKDGAAACSYSDVLADLPGCRGIASSQAVGDDIQQARNGGSVAAGGIVVLPGPNGTIESTPGGNDVFFAGKLVATDPLRMDTDSDLVGDGRERDMGGDPTNPLDSGEFKDIDQDGLTDFQEAALGWTVTVAGVPYRVLSSPSRPDSDGDGLPDLAESILATDPNKRDTDGDGLSDFDELADFTQFNGLGTGNPGFVLDAASSKQYGTNPLKSDSDTDGLNDKFELVTGYYVLMAGETQPRWIHTNPMATDTDLDGVIDYNEVHREPKPSTDATDPDSDDDGRSDGIEYQSGTDPLAKDISVTVKFGQLTLDKIPDSSGSPPPEVSWFYTVTPPGADRVLVSNACDTSQECFWFDGVSSKQCYMILTPSSQSFTLNHNDPRNDYGSPPTPPDGRPHYKGIYRLTLKPGETFSVQGILFELDPPTAQDCGSAPDYIPSFVQSDCVTRFSQTFSFNDFDSGGKANFPFPNGLDTQEHCNWTQEIFVTGL